MKIAWVHGLAGVLIGGVISGVLHKLEKPRPDVTVYGTVQVESATGPPEGPYIDSRIYVYRVKGDKGELEPFESGELLSGSGRLTIACGPQDQCYPAVELK